MGLIHKLFSWLEKDTDDPESKMGIEASEDEQIIEEPAKDAYAAMEGIKKNLTNLSKHFEENPEDEEILMKKLKDL